MLSERNLMVAREEWKERQVLETGLSIFQGCLCVIQGILERV